MVIGDVNVKKLLLQTDFLNCCTGLQSNLMRVMNIFGMKDHLTELQQIMMVWITLGLSYTLYCIVGTSDQPDGETTTHVCCICIFVLTKNYIS